MTAASTITRKQATTQADSVVTPERYATGIDSFPAWMSAIEQNQEAFQRHHDEWEPDAGDLATLRSLIETHGVRALVIGEDWCPDVWRGLPVVARLQEETGLETRYFLRDQNKDIMAEFLKDGEFESIPTVVFYDRDFNYLGHWIERSDRANQEMPGLREQYMSGVERGTPEFDAANAKYREATWEYAKGWRDSQLSELVALLQEALA